jgi:hypothetical protein
LFFSNRINELVTQLEGVLLPPFAWNLSGG